MSESPTAFGTARAISFVRPAVCRIQSRRTLMNTPSYALIADRRWSLTRTDMVLCVLPIALFLSIVSLV